MKRVQLLASAPLVTDYGEFVEHYFTDGVSFFAALTLGAPFGDEPVPTRVHSDCLSAHVFNGRGCNCREQMSASQKRIVQQGYGIIVWLPQDGRGNGHAAKLIAESFKKKGLNQSESYVEAGFEADARQYGAAVAILQNFDIKSVILLSGNDSKKTALQGGGIVVAETHSVG